MQRTVHRSGNARANRQPSQSTQRSGNDRVVVEQIANLRKQRGALDSELRKIMLLGASQEQRSRVVGVNPDGTEQRKTWNQARGLTVADRDRIAAIRAEIVNIDQTIRAFSS